MSIDLIIEVFQYNLQYIRIFHSLTWPEPYTIFPHLYSMTTSSNGNIFLVTDPLWEESPMTSLTKASDASFTSISAWKKRFSKQSRRRVFETPWRSLWRHRYAIKFLGGCMKSNISSDTISCNRMINKGIKDPLGVRRFINWICKDPLH